MRRLSWKTLLQYTNPIHAKDEIAKLKMYFKTFTFFNLNVYVSNMGYIGYPSEAVDLSSRYV